METLGAARLAKEIPAQRAVAAIVPREEITAVLKDPEGSPELSLRVVEGSDQPTVIAMTWSRDELARVLEQATSDNVVLTFDREELSRALSDVEAHGLRERALVFAVAATSALGTGAAIANAMPTNDDQGPAVAMIAPAVSAADSMTDVSSAGGYSAVEESTGAADTMVSDASSGAGYAAPASGSEASAASAGVTDVSSAGGYTAPAIDTGGSASVTDVSSAGGYTAPAIDTGGSASVTDVSSAGGYTAPTIDTGSSAAGVTDVSSAGGYTAPTIDTGSSAAGVTDVSSAGGYTAPTIDTGSSAGVTDVSSGAGYGTVEATSSSGEILGIPRPDVTDGLLAGAILLTITGVTFASRHTRPVRPA